jgi:hypothetical protein
MRRAQVSRGAAGELSTARPVEGIAQVSIMLMIGLAAGAGSFTHVHDVAQAHGQEGWLAWADAVVLELMSIAAGLELRRRKRAGISVAFPAAVLTVAVVLSLGAQVVDAEPSPLGWIAAAIPALGFLVMVKIALANTGHSVASTGRIDSACRCAGTPRGSRPTADEGQSKSSRLDPVVIALLPAARSAAEILVRDGRRLSRQALSGALRAEGYAVSNARASALLCALKSERDDAVLAQQRRQGTQRHAELSAAG